MIDVGGVVHQRAELPVQALVQRRRQPQVGAGQVGGVNLHPAQVQMLQAVVPQGLGEALRRRLPGAVAHQARHFPRARRQQCLHDMYADETVSAGDNHFAHIAHAG